MAAVYLARDLRHERSVAIKVFGSEVGEAVGAERFLREIRIAAGLQHPNIVPLLDSGTAADRLYYVMPRVEGESLRARLVRERQLPVDEALALTAEIAEALDYAHSRQVLHRDIKPDNILISNGHAMVADFGIARAIESAGGERLTETGIALGSRRTCPDRPPAGRRLDGRSGQ